MAYGASSSSVFATGQLVEKRHFTHYQIFCSKSRAFRTLWLLAMKPSCHSLPCLPAIEENQYCIPIRIKANTTNESGNLAWYKLSEGQPRYCINELSRVVVYIYYIIYMYTYTSNTRYLANMSVFPRHNTLWISGPALDSCPAASLEPQAVSRGRDSKDAGGRVITLVRR